MPIQTARPITSGTQWTTPLGINGWFNVSISNAAGGSLGGTIVTVQRSWDLITYFDVDRWTKTSEDVGFEPDLVYYTIGVKAGEYGGTPCNVAISVLGSMRS
jgi:hypothetical protein